MSWLSKHLGIRLDSHTLGNVLKNVSPAAAFVPGVGLLGTAALSAAGDLARGKNIGQAAIGAAKNASIGAGARAGVGALKSALSKGGAPVAGTSAGGGIPIPADANLTGAHIPTGADFGYGGGSHLPGSGILGKTLGFIKENPTASAMGLQAVGNLATSGAQNRAANAQATLLEQQQAENDYDLQRRKKRDAELDPLYGSLGTALGQSLSRPIAGNPYLTGG